MDDQSNELCGNWIGEQSIGWEACHAAEGSTIMEFFAHYMLCDMCYGCPETSDITDLGNRHIQTKSAFLSTTFVWVGGHL